VVKQYAIDVDVGLVDLTSACLGLCARILVHT